MKYLIRIGVVVFSFGIISCSIFEDDDYPDQSHIDYLVGVEGSGQIKRQINYSDTEDETVNSDIVFEYKNDRLITKKYNDFLDGSSSYVLKQEDLKYEGDRLLQMIQYFRNTQAGPLKVSKTYFYAYPDENRKVETIYLNDDVLRDSVVYTYSGAFLIEERHYNHQGEWGSKFEYNEAGKLYKSSDLDGSNLVINYFDENGVLKSSAGMDDDGIDAFTIISYERETTRDRLIIRKFIKDIRFNTVEPFLTSHKVFKNGKLVEEVKYHPTMGGQWYCSRFQYY